MEYKVYTRFFRRALAALLALTAAVLLCAPAVLAEEGGVPEDPETSAVDNALTAEDYAGIAAQLEAVARAEGRAIAGNMLAAAFTAVSPVAADNSAEEAVAATAAPVSASGAGIVVHTRASGWSLSGVLPFFAVVAVAMMGIGFALISIKRMRFGGRRTAYARSYRPMRDLTFREETFEKRSSLRLNR